MGKVLEFVWTKSVNATHLNNRKTKLFGLKIWMQRMLFSYMVQNIPHEN